jgi:hypothetical protein
MVGLDSALIWVVEFGKNSRGNLRNVGDAERRNTVVKDVRDGLGRLVIGEFDCLVLTLNFW